MAFTDVAPRSPKVLYDCELLRLLSVDVDDPVKQIAAPSFSAKKFYFVLRIVKMHMEVSIAEKLAALDCEILAAIDREKRRLLPIQNEFSSGNLPNLRIGFPLVRDRAL